MQAKECSTPISLWQQARFDWKWLVAGALFSYCLMSILIGGWPAGLIPDLNHPFAYGGDGKFVSWQIQRVMDGGLANNSRSGYPFGSNFLDYPNSDLGSLLILKGLGMLTHTYYGAYNLYILLAFPLIFLTSFLVLRIVRLKAPYAMAAALLFTFAPFHLYRMFSHPYYGWYFVVPLFFYYGWTVFFQDPSIWPYKSIKKIILTFGTLIIASSFGVYFAVFGIITLLTCGIASLIKTKKLQNLVLSIMLSTMVVVGVGINLLPNIVHIYQNGKNVEVASRSPIGVEIYGLKLVHLLFPPAWHRIHKLGSVVTVYSQNFLINEATYSSSLGLFASLGFIIIIFSIFLAALGKKINITLGLLGMLILSFLLISSVGGLNVLFALFITPAIRGWNRISIFISFASLTGLFLVLQSNARLTAFSERYKVAYWLIPIALTGVGLLDQTASSYKAFPATATQIQHVEKAFIASIEAQLPPGAAIYQLPYMRFPEAAAVVNLGDYELLGGFLNSKTLRWSHGGMKGREGDLFYRYLAEQPLTKQLDVIKRLGFAGIYIDCRGFANNGKELIAELNKLLHKQPALVRQDNQVVFYRLDTSPPVDLSRLSAREIMTKADFIVTKDGPSYPSTLADGIMFSREAIPLFIKNIKGLSGREAWGRWSDANLAPSVTFDFTDPLPNQFNLIMSLTAFGPNVNQQLKIIIGSKTYETRLQSGIFKTQVAIDLAGEKVSTIEFIPPYPSNNPGDRRKFGVGFVSLSIENQARATS